MVATQHGFGLLFLDTGTTERKSEFVTAAHGQDGVKQTSRGKNIHGGQAKIRPQGLVDGLRDDLRMTDGVEAVLVDPLVKGGDIQMAYFLALPSHSMQGHRACSPFKEGLAGFQGWCEIVGAQETLYRHIRVDQLVLFAVPHFYDGVTRSEQSHAFG